MAKKYIIKVENNSAYCGIGAGGVQFANGQAIINACPLVNWYMEHEGYSVEEVVEKKSEEKKSEEKKKEAAE